ncbi:hypothetical protein J2Y03_004611 [Neobacillus niacini]|uniref:hypothetical protein n=1 Tax=Neobacillus niacini TaxID=86668 RepID=UPI0028582FC9|nr:hypothetical protein [Neobacillus niacini]
MKEEILLLKIHNGLKEGKSYYEALRGNWKISEKRFQSIKYVAGINRGKVVCIFQPTNWSIISEGQEKGRKVFDGIEAPNNILLDLQESEELLLKKFGSGSPVAYVSLKEIVN